MHGNRGDFLKEKTRWSAHYCHRCRCLSCTLDAFEKRETKRCPFVFLSLALSRARALAPLGLASGPLASTTWRGASAFLFEKISTGQTALDTFFSLSSPRGRTWPCACACVCLRIRYIVCTIDVDSCDCRRFSSSFANFDQLGLAAARENHSVVFSPICYRRCATRVNKLRPSGRALLGLRHVDFIWTSQLCNGGMQ